jgi:co-chaperonin GroES (HSP10)
VAKRLEPAGDHIIVLDSVASEKTLDGIILPDNEKQQEMVFGTVIFKGPLCSPWTHIEDTVAYGPYAGKFIIFQGVQFRLMKEGQIETYVRNIEE